MSLKNSAPAPVRGLVTAEIGGQLRIFKFGMNALSEFSKMNAGLPGDFTERMANDTIGALRDMAYCGLKARAADNDLPADFSPELVGDWIDEMPQAEWNRVSAALLACMTVGKPAPKPSPATEPALMAEPA